MALSPELQALQDRQSNYQGNVNTLDALSSKMLHMIVGPTGIGKSSIIGEVLQLEPEWDIVGTRTTRDRKPDGGDPEHYQTAAEGVTVDKMKNEIINGELVNYSIHNNGNIYGTLPEQFRKKHNLLPVIPDSIKQLQQAGFRETDTTYIVSPAEQWKNRIMTSRVEYSDLIPRLEEGIASIEYAIDNIEWLNFVENINGKEGLQKAARKVISIAKGYQDEKITDDINRSLQGMLAVAKDLAVHS